MKKVLLFIIAFLLAWPVKKTCEAKDDYLSNIRQHGGL